MADLIAVRDLKVYLDVDAGTVKAVDGVSFRIPAGGTVALVGESGSGKSVVAQSIMGILPRIARIESGEILFRDPARAGEVDISRLDPAGRPMQDIRGARISIIFQEPMTALSPLHTIGNQIGEALALHRPELGKPERREAVLDMLRRVGFPDPAKAEHTYPFELSGGRRCSSPTSRPPRSTSRSRRRSCSSSRTCSASSTWRCCSLPTTSAWWRTWPTRWWCCTAGA
jgi:peptide/nickel transport system ATP-binding protein